MTKKITKTYEGYFLTDTGHRIYFEGLTNDNYEWLEDLEDFKWAFEESSIITFDNLAIRTDKIIGWFINYY